MNKQSLEGKETSIKVFIRVRPLIASEIGTETVAEVMEDEKTVDISDNITTIQTTFDQSFGQKKKQIEIFKSFEPYVSKVVEGYNLTIFAYGQTGSGKTYTMFGSDWENSINRNSKGLYQNTFLQHIENDQNFAGITPRAIYKLFNTIESSSQEDIINAKIYCSFLQIYNEKVYDLLQDNPRPQPLQIHQSKIDGIFVEGLSEYNVNHYLDCLELMKRGQKNRIIRTTSMNVKSSRSHTIFQVLLESSTANTKGNFKKARLNLCDLAGSEKVNKFEAMGEEHFKQLRNINQSLTTLGKVIHSLSSGTKGIAAFRESKLTRLLQDSLTLNTFTFIIGNISPSKTNLQETINTLKFVQRARHIVMKVKPVQFNGMNSEMVLKLQKEVLYLKQLLNLKRKGLNSHDIHVKLMSLQEQNDRLKKGNVPISQVEKLVQENRRMKMQITKLQMNTQYPSEDLQTNSNMNHSYGSKRFEDISEAGNQKKSQQYSMHVDTTTDIFSKQKYYVPSVGGSVGSVGSIGSRNSLVKAGKNLLSNSQYSQSQISETSIRDGSVKKQKKKILGRLEQLDRIQKQNTQKLQRELQQMQKRHACTPQPNVKVSKPIGVKKQDPLNRLNKVGSNYEQKIRQLQAKLLKHM